MNRYTQRVQNPTIYPSTQFFQVSHYFKITQSTFKSGSNDIGPFLRACASRASCTERAQLSLAGRTIARKASATRTGERSFRVDAVGHLVTSVFSVCALVNVHTSAAVHFETVQTFARKRSARVFALRILRARILHGCALVYVFTRCSISDESAFADAAVPARKVLASCILCANVFNVALVEIGALETVASEARVA